MQSLHQLRDCSRLRGAHPSQGTLPPQPAASCSLRAPSRLPKFLVGRRAFCTVCKGDASKNGSHVSTASALTPPPAPAPARAEAVGEAPLLTATLVVKCADQKGVVASLAQLLFGFGCNILSSDQYTDTASSMFYQRLEIDYSDLLVGPGNSAVLEAGITEVARKYGMEWKISYRERQARVALLVSKLDHCLYDLLIRRESGELQCQIPVVISNHPDLESVTKKFGIPFRYLPLDGKDPASKAAQEAQIDAILDEEGIDLIVLARYMQIFSPDFCQRHWHRTINVHHSFLPAFEGAKPYHRAHERGVKIIGATAHFATSDLDCGPIIDQAVRQITHRDSVADMIRKGRDLERLVLSRAVRWQIDNRIIVHKNKTVVFED